VVGTLVGVAAGFYGGRLDNAVMRLTDLFLSIPLLVLLIIASRATGGSIRDIVLVLSLALWMFLARIVRGLFLSLREKEFVEAAHALGGSTAHIVFRHILPNTVDVIIVNATVTVAQAVLIESALSFIGLGVRRPDASLGLIINENKNELATLPWLFWVPFVFIVLIGLSVNFIGDGLRDALDPRQKRVRA
jgi:peptide/nickel transport system permease protein